jgi:hypothetical protein
MTSPRCARCPNCTKRTGITALESDATLIDGAGYEQASNCSAASSVWTQEISRPEFLTCIYGDD